MSGRLGMIPTKRFLFQLHESGVVPLGVGKQREILFFQFLRQEKKYWLLPIVIVFVLFGLLIVFSQSSAVAPFIYTLF